MAHHSKSLKYQILDKLDAKAAFGQSKHARKKKINAEEKKIKHAVKVMNAPETDSSEKAKAAQKLEAAAQTKSRLESDMNNKIYSYSSMKTYRASFKQFYAWLKENHPCKTEDEAKSHVGEYLQSLEARGLSPYTIAKHSCALCKALSCSPTEFGYTPPKRHRSDVTLHTGEKWKGHYSEANHPDIKEICEASGLRRCELMRLRPENVWRRTDGAVVVHVCCGKGGRARDVICLNDAPLRWAEKAAAANQDLVVSHIPNRAPIHEYRQHYAAADYARKAAAAAGQKNPKFYKCRLDMAGTTFNRSAMRGVSRNLGHNRLDVVTAYVKEPNR